MEKVLTIDGKQIGIRASALTVRLYRARTKRDLIKDMFGLKKAVEKKQAALERIKPGQDATEEEKNAYDEAMQDAQLEVMDLQIFEDAAWIMARQYAKAHPEAPAIPDSPEQWLDDMDGVFDIIEIFPEVMELWGMSQETTSVPKNR